MDDKKTKIAENLVRLRTAYPLTQAELARQLNYSDKAVSKWERGESLPDIFVFKQLAELYGVTVDDILRIEDDRPAIAPQPIQKRKGRQHFVVTALSVVAVLFAAVMVYVLGSSISGDPEKFAVVFVFAIPAALIDLLVFACIWGKVQMRFLLISLLIWSVLLSLYVIFWRHRLWSLFLLGVPLEIAVLVVYVFWKTRRR